MGPRNHKCCWEVEDIETFEVDVKFRQRSSRDKWRQRLGSQSETSACQVIWLWICFPHKNTRQFPQDGAYHILLQMQRTDNRCFRVPGLVSFFKILWERQSEWLASLKAGDKHVNFDCSINKNREPYIARKAEETYFSGACESESLNGSKSNRVGDSSLIQNTTGFGN